MAHCTHRVPTSRIIVISFFFGITGSIVLLSLLLFFRENGSTPSKITNSESTENVEINVKPNTPTSPSFMGTLQPTSAELSAASSCDLLGKKKWTDLSLSLKSAAISLGYDECSWDFPPYNNKIEYQPWSYLKLSQQENAKILGCNEYSWNINANHFYGISWDDLAEYGVKECAENLGYSQISWDNNSTDPESTEKWWKDLSEVEKGAAKCIGYGKKTWNTAYVCDHKINFEFTQILESVDSCVMTPSDGRGDRVGHAIALLPGEFICSRNGRYRFGMDKFGSLVWKDEETNKEIILFEGQNEYSFALSMNADLVVYDEKRQPVWNLPCIYEVHFGAECLVNPMFYYDCPYLHLHADGVVALNYLENGYDDDSFWGEVNIKKVYEWEDGLWDLA